MINKKHLIFAFLVFFIFVFKANASVVINEVQISPTEGRFIELYNNGSSSVDLTDWYIQRKTATGSTFGSLVSKTNFSGKTIPAGGYFIISKNILSSSDIVVDGLTLTESNTIQLKNNNQEVTDTIGWGDCGSNCVAINPPSDKSIQKVNGDYVINTPTPGEANHESNSDDSGDTDNNDDGGTDFGSSISTSSDKEILPPLKITTKINIPKVIVAGDPFTFSSITSTNRKEIYNVGRFLWNFGDGMVIWTKESGPFEYTYEYPGEYVLTLSYFDNSFTEIPDATDRIVVKVIDSGLSVSSVGTLYDPYIEMVNNSSSEIDLSGWKIIAGSHTFNFSNGTSILSKKKIKLSPKITGFTGDDIKNVIILNPNGEMVSMYPLVKRSVYKSNISSITNTSNNNYNKEDLKESDNIINLDNLGASASTPTSKIPDYIYPIITLVLIIAIGIVSFLMFQNKNKKNEDLESSINSDDIKIIE